MTAICQACRHYPGRVGALCPKAKRHATGQRKRCTFYVQGNDVVVALREYALEHEPPRYQALVQKAHRLAGAT